MGLHSTYRFSNGRLEKIDTPEWMRLATEQEDVPRRTVLSKAGLVYEETFGEAGHTIDIYRTKDYQYYIEYWDCNQAIFEVHIDNMGDYMTFRSQYIFPLAMLIMKSDEYDAWIESRKSERQTR
jgi:hypothetical protein